MSWQITGLLFSSAFELVMFFLVRARLRTFTSAPFCAALLFNSFWALGYAIELLTPTLEGKMLVFQIRCSLLAFYALAWIETVFRMTRDRPLLKGWTLAGILVVPLVTLVLLWFPGPGQNPILRHSFWLDDRGGFGILRSTLAPWGIVYYLYNYVIWGVVAYLIYPRRAHTGWERRGRFVFMAAACIGWSADILHHFSITHPAGFNYAPTLFPLTSVLVAVALFRHRLIVLAPVARAALIERLDDGILVLDDACLVADYNHAASRILGFPENRILGRPVSDFLARWPALLDLVVSGETRRVEVRVGERFHEATLIPVAVSEQSVARARVLILRDITHRIEVETQLRLAKEAAEAAGQAQSRFLATMSHEIRTPMNGVLGFTQMLKETPLTARQGEYVDLIDQSSRTLLVIINDVLDYSKIAADQLQIERVRCELRPLAEQTVRILRPVADSKRITLELRVAGNVPEAVLGDPVRIGQILTNLLGNALKFTERGGVTLDIEAPGPDLLAFRVADTGIGIAPENQTRILDAFSQADASTTRRFGGTGLGLSITRRLCELMGGCLTLTSELGRGSVFTAAIRAPAAPDLPPVAADDAPADLDDLPAVEGLSLLVCEDNNVNRTIIRVFLTRLGHSATIVNDGVQGLERLASERFDAVLMDMEMPVMDGYEAVRRIRDSEKNGAPRSYLIALTAHAFKGERERCLALGMDDFLTKPIALPDLKAALDRVPR